MSLIGLLALIEKMVPGAPSHETLSVPSQRELKISSVTGHPPLLIRDHFSSPRVVAKPCQRAEGLRPSSQRPQYPNLYWCFKHRVGAHLEQDSVKGLWSNGEKRLHINFLELNAIFLALKQFKDQSQNQTMLVATENATVVAYINKQGGTHSAEMWRIMTWCYH